MKRINVEYDYSNIHPTCYATDDLSFIVTDFCPLENYLESKSSIWISIPNNFKASILLSIFLGCPTKPLQW